MKNYIIVLCTLVFSIVANGNPINLFVNTPQSDAGNMSDLNNTSYGEYNSNIKNISLGQKIIINLPNYSTEVSITSISSDSNEPNNSYAYSASSNDKTNTLSISKSGSVLIGTVNGNNSMYRLTSIDNNIIISQTHLEDIQDHDDNYTDDVNEDFLNEINNDSNNSLSDSSIITYTVIIAYEKWFSSEHGHNQALISEYMRTLERETNEAYVNSNVNLRVKIVHYYKTSYSVSGNTLTDIGNFSNTSNDYTQELYNLRDSYSADIMILLTGDRYYSGCGRAAKIGANKDQAFAVVKNSCGIGYYSFGHEIGHLFGARHIFYNDPSSTPYTFGHGYCSPDNKWRTTMAYFCEHGWRPRIQQWSNPNINIDGVTTGTESLQFNAKVLNVRAKYVSDFRIPAPPPAPPHELAWMIPAIYYPLLLSN
jgi:hypothetical protein